MGLCHCDDPDRGRLVEGSDVGSRHSPATHQALAKCLPHSSPSPGWAGIDRFATRISDDGLELIMCFSSRDAAGVIDRGPGLETPDDGLTNRYVVERIIRIS